MCFPLIADTKSELLSKLQNIDIKVPPRSNGRVKDHVERWTICKFIATYANNDKLSYPCQLIKREHPDFVLYTSHHCMGIEVTEAINQDYARASTLTDINRNRAFEDLSLFKWGAPAKSHEELREILSREKLFGPGWVGSEVEDEFAQAAMDITLSKTKKLNSPHFAKFDENYLLIYCNLCLPALENDEACQIFSEKIRNYWSDDSFSKVVVEDDVNLFVFNTKGYELIKIYDVWNINH